MKFKQLLFVVAPVAIAVTVLATLTSFKTSKKQRPCEVTIQFSPTTSNFSFVQAANCNDVQNTSSVTAGTNFTPILNGLGCSDLTIRTTLPTFHPAGTITIWKNGSVLLTHSLNQNQTANFTDEVKAECDDYFIVTW